MRKLIMVMAFLSVVGTGFAAEGKDWRSYYEDLLKGLKSRVQRKFESRTRVSAVAAVRGERQAGDAEALYWKGGVSEAARKQTAEDRKALAGAVQLVVDGDLAAGKRALEEFLKDRSESPYAAEAKEALANLPAGAPGDREETPGPAAGGAGKEGSEEADAGSGNNGAFPVPAAAPEASATE